VPSVAAMQPNIDAKIYQVLLRTVVRRWSPENLGKHSQVFCVPGAGELT